MLSNFFLNNITIIYYCILTIYQMIWKPRKTSYKIVLSACGTAKSSTRSPGDLDRYIYKIVKNRSLLFLKEHKKRYETQLSFSKENDIHHYDTTEEYQGTAEILYETVNLLPEKCRKIFLMACLNDKGYQEIAEEMKISINTVKTQMKTALKFLRENLQEKIFLTLLYLLTKKD